MNGFCRGLCPYVPFLLSIASISPARAQQKTINIILTQLYTDTGLEVSKGETVSVTASGTMNWFTGGCNEKCLSTPAGESCPYTGFFAQGLPCWSLIGAIKGGEPFEVGDSLTFAAESSGELFLGVNDNNYPDNTGKWTAVVTLSGVTAVISFNADDVNNTTQTVAVGEQIPLTAKVSMPAGISIQSQQWSVPGILYSVPWGVGFTPS